MGKINERPEWCPHLDCKIFRCFQDNMCSGKLPEPVPHDNDFNDSQICLRHALPNDEIFDLQINKSDTYWFKLLFEVTGDKLKKTYSKEMMEWAFNKGIEEGKNRALHRGEDYLPTGLDYYLKTEFKN